MQKNIRQIPLRWFKKLSATELAEKEARLEVITRKLLLARGRK